MPGEIRNALERAENLLLDASRALTPDGLVEALLQATDRLGKCLQELERDREQ